MRKLTLIFGCSVLLISGLANAQQHSMPSGKMTDEDIIKSAMSAAPEAIAKGATVIDVGADGKIRVVRQGTRCRSALCWNSMWRNLQRDEVIVSGGEVNWLIDNPCAECLPTIDLAHVDLTGGEQRPEQHCGGLG